MGGGKHTRPLEVDGNTDRVLWINVLMEFQCDFYVHDAVVM